MKRRLPGNLNRAIAYAAGRQNTIDASVVTTANTKDWKIDDTKVFWDKINPHHLNPNSCGIKLGTSYVLANANIKRLSNGP